MQYEDPIAQCMAVSVTPVDELEAAAKPSAIAAGVALGTENVEMTWFYPIRV